MSKRIWRKQFESISLSGYRMIAIDLPAHADSDAAPETFYTLPGLAELLYTVVNWLPDNKPYILAGVSLGTKIITEMLVFEMQPLGLVLAGSSIVGKMHPIVRFLKPDTHVSVVFTDDAHEKDVLCYASETLASVEEQDIIFFLEDFKMVQPPFRSVLAKSIAEGNYNEEIELLQHKKYSFAYYFWPSKFFEIQ